MLHLLCPEFPAGPSVLTHAARKLVAGADAKGLMSMLAMQDYKFLTFARIPPPPPPPWVEQHILLQNAVQAYVKHKKPWLSKSRHQSLVSAAADVSLEWYTGMLARLHINSFRSHASPALSATQCLSD